jgi:predicted outer membrane protein
MVRAQIARMFLLSTVAILLTSIASLAQSSNPSPSGVGGVPNYGGIQPNQPDPAEMQRDRDRAFLRKIFESDQTAIKLAELAQQGSHNDNLKHLAENETSQRKHFEDQIQSIADQLGVTRPKDYSHRDKKEITKLETLSGSAFDEEYLNLALKEAQQELKDYNAEIEKTQNAALRDAAQESAKAVDAHIQLIRTMLQTIHQAGA